MENVMTRQQMIDYASKQSELRQIFEHKAIRSRISSQSRSQFNESAMKYNNNANNAMQLAYKW